MIYISKYPIKIIYNELNQIITKFVMNDKSDIENYNNMDKRLLFIPYILFYDFDSFCIEHLIDYVYDDNNELKKIDCHCNSKIHLWSKYDLHLRVGKEIIERTNKALSLLRKKGLYQKNNANSTQVFKDYRDFILCNPQKRIHLIGDVLCNIVSICTKLPYHIFGIFDGEDQKNCNIDKTHYVLYNNNTYIISNTTNNLDRITYFCNNCKKYGHTIKYCYKKKYV